MKKFVLVLIVLGGILPELFAQTPTQYWVQFRDKNGSPYSVTNPSAYLTPRSIQRRLNHSIAIDYHDLPVNKRYVDSIVAKGAHIHCRSKWFNGVSVVVTNPAMLTAIQALPFVSGTTEVGARIPHPVTNETDKLEFISGSAGAEKSAVYLETTSLNYGASFNQINMIGGTCLHNQGFQGQGMVIAVLDAGFRSADTLRAFDSLRINNQILGTWDFVAEEPTVYDDHFHGMMVLSCMAGNLPGRLVGTAPKAKYWLLRTEDAPTEKLVEEYNWAAGAEFADSVGADVINTSLGYTTFDNPAENHTYADMNGRTTPCARAVNYASNRGMAIVCSAGNSGTSPWLKIGTPADADSALAIGAVDPSGYYATFSSHGPSSSGMVKPAVAAEGQGTVLADFNSQGTTTASGTSFSSPIICGLVACLWQAHPALTNMQIFQAIIQSATQYTHPDTLMGYGKPDFCTAQMALGGKDPSILKDDFLSELHPNPFHDILHFIFWSKNAQKIVVRLYDISGRIMMDESRDLAPSSYNVYDFHELSSLSSGIYFLSVQTSKNTFVRKIMKD